MIGDDRDLEKSGRIPNRVIEWGRNGITIEADQRHARGRLKELDLERAHHTATPWSVEREKREAIQEVKKARAESRCEQGQIEAQHEWDNESDRDDRHRVQMTNDDETDSRTLTGGDITKYMDSGGTQQLSVARSTRSQVCFDAGMLCYGKPNRA